MAEYVSKPHFSYLYLSKILKNIYLFPSTAIVLIFVLVNQIDIPYNTVKLVSLGKVKDV